MSYRTDCICMDDCRYGRRVHERAICTEVEISLDRGCNRIAVAHQCWASELFRWPTLMNRRPRRFRHFLTFLLLVEVLN